MIEKVVLLTKKYDWVRSARDKEVGHVNAAAKNAVELTGKAWTGKIVSLMLAAGGHGSFMSALGLANSLMLDFRCLIVPRFLYAIGDSFEGDSLADDTLEHRVNQLAKETIKLADAVNAIR